MNIRHMRIFITLCQCGNNVTKAAKLLYMSQPSVTIVIKEIEKYYGIQLFDRISRRLYLTSCGKEFLSYAERLVSIYDDMEMNIKNTSDRVSVGASLTIGSLLMPNYVKEFYKEKSEADLRVTVEPSPMLEKKILKNDIDMALVERPIHEKNIIFEEFADDSLLLISSPNNHFENGATLSAEELKKQRFILREKGSGTRELFDSVTAENGILIEPVWEAMSTNSLINAVMNGLGISAISERIARPYINNGILYEIKVQDVEFKRKFYLIHHKDKNLSTTAKAFWEFCRQREKNFFS